MIAEYGDALDYDLYKEAGVRLRDVPETIGWGTAALIARHLPVDSELFRVQNPEIWAYSAAPMRAKLLTDLIDLVNWFRYEHALANSPEDSKPSKPKPYPAPWSKETRDSQTVGKGVSMSVEEFKEYYYGGGE